MLVTWRASADQGGKGGRFGGSCQWHGARLPDPAGGRSGRHGILLGPAAPGTAGPRVDLFPRLVNQTARHVAGGDAVFAFSTAGATTTARESDDGFVVLAGSTAQARHRGSFPPATRFSVTSSSRTATWSMFPRPSSSRSPWTWRSPAPVRQLPWWRRAAPADRGSGGSG